MIFPTFHRILNDAVVNFPNNQEEITLVVSPETLKVKNYVDDEPGKEGCIASVCIVEGCISEHP